MIVSVICIILGFIFLIKGADFLVERSEERRVGKECDL